MSQANHWWWVGYTDTTKPKGSQAVGSVITLHPGPEHVIAANLIVRGLAPRGAKPLFGLIAPDWGPPPPGYSDRLLDAKEAAELCDKWDPQHRGLAGPADIKKAFLDDEARDGDPLFKKGDR